MRTVEATVEIAPDGSMEWHLAEQLEPGEHHMLLLIQDPPPAAERVKGSGFLSLPPIDMGEWPEGFTFRREEMYDENGRM